MKKQGLVVAYALVAAFGGSTSAEAADSTVAVKQRAIVWESGSGHESHVDVAITASGDLEIKELYRTIAAGRGCTQRGASRVTCTLAGVRSLRFSLGDEEDYLKIADSRRLRLPATIMGGESADVLIGGRGEDLLLGGEGNQDVLDGARGADRLDGGPGEDTVDYGRRSASVLVNLDGRANDGAKGEGDNALVESIVGGKRNDTLLGSNASNLISGGPGADMIRGRGGDDYLFGNEGADMLFGDAGDDDIRTSGSPDDGVRDTASCGAGGDRVTKGKGDTASADCEYEYPVSS